MRLLLAPMEGLLDHHLRDILTRVGGIDRCVSEFIRVTDTLLPERVFFRIIPELAQGGCTRSGVPVRGQLLGSDPACLADNAARLASLGPTGVDLNFGCPAKIVNRHGGGASLLDDPELLHRIMAAVRRAVPAHLPVSAKMRLGTESAAQAEDCALALAQGGADEIVVHARTRRDGYRPPAHWDRIADLRAVVSVPLVANGEIWTIEDALRCREVSGCTDLMLGRGIVADPGLALALRAAAGGPRPEASTLDWPGLLGLLRLFWLGLELHITPRHRAGRLKQWLNFLRRRYPEAEGAYQRWRTLNDPVAMREALFEAR
ncbi:tRNA-dihydrouridine synthase [Ideonella sp. YS5]|uniref:tRNA-dihydrouridine synthase n=1 Tax=Ideonella sp. YS5 TaxID=3453714 RepID=UPI003EEA6483